jgi:hypothetical protein
VGEQEDRKSCGRAENAEAPEAGSNCHASGPSCDVTTVANLLYFVAREDKNARNRLIG